MASGLEEGGDDLLWRFIESAPVAIAMFDREMRYLVASRRWMTDYGLEGQEILGRSHYEVFPEIPERWKEIHRRAQAGEVVSATEDRFDRLDGTTQWLRWEIQPWYERNNTVGGIIIFTEDITAYKQSVEQYRTIVETAQEGIWVLDRRMCATYVNQRMAEMLGDAVSEILGHSLYDFITPALHDLMRQHIEERKHGRREVYDFEFRRRDGSELWALVSATPLLDEHGQFTGTFGMLTDVTERHQLIAYQREFARRTILAATEGKLLISEREEITRIAGSPLVSWQIATADDLAMIRHGVATIIQAAGMQPDRVQDFLLGISEAATNAYKHAGSGNCTLSRLEDQAFFAVVADHGPGILSMNLPEVALEPGYTTAVSLGMGYKAMIALADKVYLATGPDGTMVGIQMATQSPPPPPMRFPGLTDAW